MAEEFSDSDLGSPGVPTPQVSDEEASVDSLAGEARGVMHMDSDSSGNVLEGDGAMVAVVMPATEPIGFSSWLLRGVAGKAQELAVGVLAKPVARWAKNKEDIINFFDYAFNPDSSRLTSGLAAEARMCSMSRQAYEHMLQEGAANVFTCARVVLAASLSEVKAFLAEGAEAVSAYTSMAFDETPVWLRMGEEAELSPDELRDVLLHKKKPPRGPGKLFNGRNTGKPKVVAKVARMGHTQALQVHACFPNPCSLHRVGEQHEVAMPAYFGFQVFQVQAVCAFLLRSAGQYILMHFAIPCTLRVVDRVTTETTKAIIDEVLGFPTLNELLKAFPLVVHLTCNDRCGANNATEKCFCAAKVAGTHRLRTTCEVHKVHTCTAYQLDCQKDLASGIVNLGLAQRPGGAFDSLKNAVTLFLMARVQVFRDVAPPGPESPEHRYRLAVLDLCLPGSTQLQLKRRMVLTTLLNGDWESSDCLAHFCNGACCNNGSLDKAELCKDIVEALLPAKCPVFARHRWANAEAPTNWACLLQGVHRI